MKLGIAVVTYNRALILQNTINKILENTDCDFEFVIADDGSTDATQSIIQAAGIACIAGKNRGIAWNKNRALFHLLEKKCCDVIILLEDDSYPDLAGWQQSWIEAAQRHGHANIAGSWFANLFISGAGTAADPVICHSVSAQCSVFSREALSFAGYLDPRFRGYGGEHYEHSLRLVKLGYGGVVDKIGSIEQPAFYLIEGGISFAEVPSYRTEQEVEENRLLFDRIRHEPVYRAPWLDDGQLKIFRMEQHGQIAPPGELPQALDEATQAPNLDASHLSRAEVVQAILNLFDQPGYLEIGVNQGETFLKLQARRKVAVDPEFLFAAENIFTSTRTEEYHEVTSDSYFGTIVTQADKFDVIYIDGLHTFEQTLRDLLNAILVLTPHGVIIVDDVIPNSYHAALPDLDESVAVRLHVGEDNPAILEDGSWMGNVYKIPFFADSFLQQFSFATVRENHGQLVMWRKNRAAVIERSYEAVGRLEFKDTILQNAVFKRDSLKQIIDQIKKDR